MEEFRHDFQLEEFQNPLLRQFCLSTVSLLSLLSSYLPFLPQAHPTCHCGHTSTCTCEGRHTPVGHQSTSATIQSPYTATLSSVTPTFFFGRIWSTRSARLYQLHFSTPAPCPNTSVRLNPQPLPLRRLLRLSLLLHLAEALHFQKI